MTFERTPSSLVCPTVPMYSILPPPITRTFMFYLNIMLSKIFSIRVNQQNHMGSFFHGLFLISNVCIHRLLWFSANCLWLDIFPSHYLHGNALADQWWLALLIGYLHKEQSESNILTLFQLTAAAAAHVKQLWVQIIIPMITGTNTTC